MFVKQIFGKNRKKRPDSPTVSLTSASSFSLTSEYSIDTRSLEVTNEGEPIQSGDTTKPTGADGAVQPTEASQAGASKVKQPASEEVKAAGEPQRMQLRKESAGPSMSARRSRATTLSTYGDDSYEARQRRGRDSAMIQMLQKSRTPKKLTFPSKYPAYLKEPPGLAYEETSTSIRRRLYIEKRMKAIKDPPLKKDERKLTFVSPKTNKTLELRSLYIRRQPLVSQYFSDHFSRYHKPPFRFTNVKFYN